jgi:flagellar protein FliS
MVYNQALTAYQKTGIETADKLKLVIMCYDAAIKDLNEAQRLHENHAIEATYDKIRHVQDIITELLVALDYEKGGAISINLSRLYNFMLRQMVGINSRQDTAVYGQLVHILTGLKDAWEQIHQNNVQDQPSEAMQGNRPLAASV